MEFCKAFNDATKSFEPDMPIPVVITVYQDKSFTFETKQPPTSFFIKKTLKLKKASKTLERSIAKITEIQIKEIAEQKMNDLNTDDLEAAKKMVAGTARSMGILVE